MRHDDYGLRNLAINARDAMLEYRVLTLETSRLARDVDGSTCVFRNSFTDGEAESGLGRAVGPSSKRSFLWLAWLALQVGGALQS